MKFLDQVKAFTPKGFEVDIEFNNELIQVEIFHIENYNRVRICVIINREKQITITENKIYITKHVTIESKYRFLYHFLLTNMHGEGKEIKRYVMNTRPFMKTKNAQMQTFDEQ